MCKSEEGTPVMGVGREDFEERREQRVERLENRAAAAAAKSRSAYDRSCSIADRIPMGQPILVGHHSEGRHRRDIAKIDSAMRTSVEAGREAERLASAAQAAESNTAISSDDPDAVAKLRAKLAKMEGQREAYKAHNKKARKEGGEKLPSYALTNLGGNIRRVKQRIAELEAHSGQIAREEEVGAFTVRENPETNRVEVDLGRRATKDECRELKSYGFKWSRTNDAWQRLANNSAWHNGLWVAKQIGGAA